MSTFGPDGEIDPHRGVIVLCVGRKGSGKSVYALLLFRSYPGDRLVVDVAGDDGPWGDDVITFTGSAADLPSKLPQRLRRYKDGDTHGKALTWRYVPDPGSPTFEDDIDYVIGLAIRHDREICILVHEVGVVAPAAGTRPNMRRLLMHNRHNKAKTLLMCGPRPQDINALCVQQADLVVVFDLLNVNDRKRIAENIQWDTQAFHYAVIALVQHEHLVYDANVDKPADGEPDERLTHMEALPAEVVAAVERWAKGKPDPAAADGKGVLVQ